MRYVSREETREKKPTNHDILLPREFGLNDFIELNGNKLEKRNNFSSDDQNEKKEIWSKAFIAVQ